MTNKTNDWLLEVVKEFAKTTKFRRLTKEVDMGEVNAKYESREVPEKLNDMMLCHKAAELCMMVCLSYWLPFKKRKALHYSILSVSLKIDFWNEVQKLYTDIDLNGNHGWVYNVQEKLLKRLKK